MSYGIFTERYTVKLPDTPGVVSGNRIIFTPNHWVKVTGSYANINIDSLWQETSIWMTMPGMAFNEKLKAKEPEMKRK